MKFIYLAVLLIPFVSAQAEEAEKFPEHKAKMISQLEERIGKLQELKACAEKAADKEALKACHKGMKEWRDDKRGEFRDGRKNRREERRKAKEGRESEE